MGILGFALVFGFGIGLVSCDMNAEITVTNASQYEADDVVTARVYMQGRGDALATQSIPRNQSVTFTLASGDYRVSISRGYSTFSYPQNGSVTPMSGKIQLRFNGNSITGSSSPW